MHFWATNDVITAVRLNGDVKQKSTTYTMVDGDDTILCNASAAPFTVTIPTGIPGYKVTIKKTDSSFNAVTISGSGSELPFLLKGETDVLVIQSDGTNWWIIQKPLPSGIIDQWHGLLANIPKSWVLCDGTNGTPDMRSRFVRGAPAGVNPGGVGGSDTHVLTEAQMPIHNHIIYVDGGAHTHTYIAPSSTTYVDAGTYKTVLGDYWSIETGASPHSHDASSIPTGSGSSHNNMPAYIQLAFIMKL